MTETSNPASALHVVLIGINAYPPHVRQLYGCVNDIDAVERLLLTAPGIGIPPDMIHITRLASQHPDAPSTTSLATLPATKAYIVKALRALTGSRVGPDDRVLIYYSGHGHQLRWRGASAWHEALVAADLNFVYDVEMNALVNAITERTRDLTIILDCCHSAGALRGDLVAAEEGEMARLLEPQDRGATDDFKLGPRPDASILSLRPATADERVAPGMLRAPTPHYVVVAAAQADERAFETVASAQPHGRLTLGLLNLVQAMTVEQRAALRWGDIWSDVLDQVDRLKSPGKEQHPWLVGRPERHVFGGAWTPGELDLGYPVTQSQPNAFAIKAGVLLGVTEGAHVAVYRRDDPPRFPIIDSPEDMAARLGTLVVERAERATALARPLDAPLSLSGEARGRLVKPGVAARLKVRLQPAEPTTVDFLKASPLLELVPPDAVDVDLFVDGSMERGWLISDAVTLGIASVPSQELRALRAGVEHYAVYDAALRLGRLGDAELRGLLQVTLLDCTAWNAADVAVDPMKPNLPEAIREGGIYSLTTGTKVAIQFIHAGKAADQPRLYVTALLCTAFGGIEKIGEVTVRPDDQQVIWMPGQLGVPFEVWPSGPLPGTPSDAAATDRLIIVGTTRPGVSLDHLALDRTVQQVVDDNITFRGSLLDEDRSVIDGPPPAAPADLWTGQTIPMRVRPGSYAFQKLA